ncbi:FxLYD domain-containing protein [Halomonas elongata]|uniref:FxLYD domain-containing protein n=1 Tax=Halomonas elongata TaxID=2746 RepID=UPI0038D402E3
MNYLRCSPRFCPHPIVGRQADRVEGDQIGNAFANTNDLAPGTTWRYRAQTPYKEVGSVRLTDVTETAE